MKKKLYIFFSLVLLFVPFINLIFVFVIFKKYIRWLKNEIISQSKLNKFLTIILVFTFIGRMVYQYSYEPQILLGGMLLILLYYHIPRIIAYILLNRLSISNITKAYNKTLTVLLLFSLVIEISQWFFV